MCVCVCVCTGVHGGVAGGSVVKALGWWPCGCELIKFPQVQVYLHQNLAHHTPSIPRPLAVPQPTEVQGGAPVPMMAQTTIL